MTEQLHFHFLLSCTGEGNGNPLQCSWLENPRAWWASVYGLPQNRTRLKQLSSSSSSTDLFKKIRDTKGIFHAKKGSIKDRNSMDLTETEEIKKNTWKNYTKKVLMTRITTMV